MTGTGSVGIASARSAQPATSVNRAVIVHVALPPLRRTLRLSNQGNLRSGGSGLCKERLLTLDWKTKWLSTGDRHYFPRDLDSRLSCSSSRISGQPFGEQRNTSRSAASTHRPTGVSPIRWISVTGTPRGTAGDSSASCPPRSEEHEVSTTPGQLHYSSRRRLQRGHDSGSRKLEPMPFVKSTLCPQRGHCKPANASPQTARNEGASQSASSSKTFKITNNAGVPKNAAARHARYLSLSCRAEG